MKEKILNLENLISEIEKVYMLVGYGNRKEGFDALTKLMPELSKNLGEFLDNAGKFSEMGIDIPEDVIVQQIHNLAEAIENKDSILLTDTLNYEIKNTLLFYIDIIRELEKENIVV